MTKRLYIAVWALAVGALVASGAEAQGTPKTTGETFEYTIQKGDTCAKIAKRFYGNKYRWDLIHQANPDMGPTPHKLKPGEKLILPKLDQGPDAKLTAVQRVVQTREPKQARWLRARVGKDLYRGWRVNTLERSAAEVTFRDDSTVQMREKTLIIIYGGGSTYRTARRQTSEATLERGALRSRLGEFRLKVRTPTAEADLRGGSSVVSVDERGTSRLSNHEGGAANFKVAEGKASVRVKPGFGSKLAKGEKKPARPKPLPPTPVWKDRKERVYAGFDGIGASVGGAWKPVKIAAYYRVEVVREGGESTIIAATTVPSSVTEFEVHRLPEGVYKARVSALDGDFFESKLSKPLWIDVRMVSLDLPGDSELAAIDQDEVYSKPGATRVLVGTKVRAPETFICSVAGGVAGAEIQLTEPGPQELTCRSERTKIAETIPVDVVQPNFVIPGADEPPELVRGEPLRVPIEVTSDIELPAGVRFVGPDGVDLEADGTEEIEVTAGEGSPDAFPVEMVVGEGESAVVLGSLPFTAKDPEPEPEPTGRPYVPQEALGLALSPNALGLTDDRREGSGFWLNVSSNGDGPAADGYWRASVGLEVAPIRRLRLGVAGALDMQTEGVVPAERGDRDLLAWVGYRLFTEDDLALYAELGAWFPLGTGLASIGTTRLIPAFELSYELVERVLLRTRQGAIVEVSSSGLHAWASAYGVDVKIVRRFAVGVEADLVVGSVAGAGIAAPAIGGGLSVLLGPAALHAGARYGINSDFEALVGRLTLSFGVRFAFE